MVEAVARSATSVTDLGTSPGSAPRVTAVDMEDPGVEVDMVAPEVAQLYHI